MMLVLNTKIFLLDGTAVSVEELSKRDEPFWVYAFDRNINQIVPAKATSKIIGEKIGLIRVILDNDEEVICDDHCLFILRGGDCLEAKNLSIGTSLMPLYKDYFKGYEKIYSPSSHRWITTHWMVVHHLRIHSLSQIHMSDCNGCRLTVHHKNYTPKNNDPMNLEVMFVCQHKSLPRKPAESPRSGALRNVFNRGMNAVNFLFLSLFCYYYTILLK